MFEAPRTPRISCLHDVQVQHAHSQAPICIQYTVFTVPKDNPISWTDIDRNHPTALHTTSEVASPAKPCQKHSRFPRVPRWDSSLQGLYLWSALRQTQKHLKNCHAGLRRHSSELANEHPNPRMALPLCDASDATDSGFYSGTTIVTDPSS